MAIKSKVQLASDIAGSTFTAPQKTILGDMVDSYQDVFPQIDTTTRNALTPVLGRIIYNTDTDRYEYWNGTVWFGIGQDLSTPLVVKIDLTSADILAADTTPIPVAAAPGSGYALIPISCAYRFTYGSVAYTNNVFIVLKSASKTTADPYLSIQFQVFQATANRSGSLPANTGTGIDAIVENDGLELKATGAIATGDGTLTVWVTYSLIAY